MTPFVLVPFLAVFSAAGVAVAVVAVASARPRLAHRALGVSLTTLALGMAVAALLDPAPRINAGGVSIAVVILGTGLLGLRSAARGIRAPWLLALATALAAVSSGLLFYLWLFFRPF